MVGKEEGREGERLREEGGARKEDEMLEKEEGREGEEMREEGGAKKEEMTEEGEGRICMAGVDDEDSGDKAGKVCEQRRTSGELGGGGSKGVSAVEEETRESVELGDDGSEVAVILGQRGGSEEDMDTRPTDGRLTDQTFRPITPEQHTESSDTEPTAAELASSSSVHEHRQDPDQDILSEVIAGGTGTAPELSLAPEENIQQSEVAVLKEESHDSPTRATEMDALAPIVDNCGMSTNDGGSEGLVALDESKLPGDDGSTALSENEDDNETKMLRKDRRL